MGKRILVAVAFLVSLVAVVYPESPYMSAGYTASADYESCQKACNDRFATCMSRCDNMPVGVEQCQADCRHEKQQCNCQ